MNFKEDLETIIIIAIELIVAVIAGIIMYYVTA